MVNNKLTKRCITKDLFDSDSDSSFKLKKIISV